MICPIDFLTKDSRSTMIGLISWKEKKMEIIQLSDEKENKKLQESSGKIFLDYIKRANAHMPSNVKIELFESDKLVLRLEEHKGYETTSQTYTVTMSEKKVTVIKEITDFKCIPRNCDSTYHTKKNTSVTEFELTDDSLTITKGEAYQRCREDGFGGADTFIIPIKSVEDIKSSSIETFGHSRSEITKTEYDRTGIEDLSKGINHSQLRPKEKAVQKKLH